MDGPAGAPLSPCCARASLRSSHAFDDLDGFCCQHVERAAALRLVDNNPLAIDDPSQKFISAACASGREPVAIAAPMDFLAGIHTPLMGTISAPVK
jgi:hypothetical protein